VIVVNRKRISDPRDDEGSERVVSAKIQWFYIRSVCADAKVMFDILSSLLVEVEYVVGKMTS